MFKQISEVADARLVTKENKERGLYGATKTTATLSVRPKPGRTISTPLAHSLRKAVASGLNMSADDVTVFDTSGKVVSGPENQDGYESAFLDRKQEFADHFQKTIEHALSKIPHVIVAVNVELDTLKTSRERKMQSAKPFATKTREEEESDDSTQSAAARQPGVRPNMPANVAQGGAGQTDHRKKKTVNTGDNVPGEQTYLEKDYEGLPLKSVQATVSIPEDYFKQIAQVGPPESDPAKLDAKVKAVRDKTLLEVKTIVAKLLPPSVAPAKADDLVTVTAYERLDANAAMADVSLTTTITELASQYGGPAALLAFALWAVFTLQRSPAEDPRPAPAAAPAIPAGRGSLDEGDDGTMLEQKPNREPSVRDKLQSSVRDNPEMAARFWNGGIMTQRG